VPDYNGPEQDGVAMFQVNQAGGKRFSAADAYLLPVAERSNLEIRPHATVLGVQLDGTRATGVRIRRGRRGEEVIAAGEVILSAGAIGSPQLLALSGIGAPDELRAVGVTARHALPGVGANLQDHPAVAVIFHISDSDTLLHAEGPKALAEWLLRHSGPLSSSVAEVTAFVRTRPGLPAADVQFHMGAAYFEDHGQETYDDHAMVIAPVLISPRARGRVWLRSADPTDKPCILTNSLSHPKDLASLVAGVKLARTIAAQPPAADIVIEELKPGADIDGDRSIEEDIRRRLILLYHPVGTCRMSDTHPEAVVDSQLRVHGIQGLRVVDASVMPIIPGGNTHAPTVMIAERAADLIAGVTPPSPELAAVTGAAT
jgi:choline dehydrogenase